MRDLSYGLSQDGAELQAPEGELWPPAKQLAQALVEGVPLWLRQLHDRLIVEELAS